jgi:hypothetical protein
LQLCGTQAAGSSYAPRALLPFGRTDSVCGRIKVEPVSRVALVMPEELSLLDMLVRLTSERDALEALLELTPESHNRQVRAILVQLQRAMDDVTSALVRWTPE